MIIYALRAYLYDGSRKSPKIAKMLFSNDGPGRTAWSHPATRDSNCSSNISRSHFRIVFGGIGLVWIWPFRTSLTLCTTAVPSALRPNHFPESLRMPSEVPLFEKSGLLHFCALGRNVRDLPMMQDRSLTMHAHTLIL